MTFYIFSIDGNIESSITSPWVVLISENDQLGSLVNYKYKLEFK